MASDLENLKSLFGEMSQAEHADEQEQEDRRDNLRSRIYTIGQLVEQETEQAEPLLGPLVKRGMTTVIGGYGGAGKSTMALQMVKSIVTGEEFLGWDGAGDSTAFIIDLEQGLSVAQNRVWEAFTGKPVGNDTRSLKDRIIEDVGILKDEWEHVHYADWQEGVELHQPGPGLDVVREVLEERRPDVVMIDPVYKLFMGTDMNEQLGVTMFVREIQKLRTEFGFALILPMHPRKPGLKPSGLTMHDLYGSYIWSAWAETIMMIRRNGELSSLQFEKDRVGTGPIIGSSWPLDFAPGRGFRRSAEGAPGDKPGSAISRIWMHLQRPENRGVFFDRGQLTRDLNLKPDTAKDALEEMRKRKNQGLPTYDSLVCAKDGNRWTYAYKPRVTQPLAMVIEQPAPLDDEWSDW